MKVKEITKRGEKRWLKAESKDTTCQQWWLNLSNGDRADMMDAFERSRDIGFTLRSAVDYFETQGRGKSFLKKCTLSDASGTTGSDKRKKNLELGPKASGFLGQRSGWAFPAPAWSP